MLNYFCFDLSFTTAVFSDGSSSANYRVNSKSSVRPRVYKSRHSGIGAVCSSGSGLSSSSTENVTNLNQRLPSNDGQTKTSNEESGGI